jgi:hypothetical protein
MGFRPSNTQPAPVNSRFRLLLTEDSQGRCSWCCRILGADDSARGCAGVWIRTCNLSSCSALWGRSSHWRPQTASSQPPTSHYCCSRYGRPALLPVYLQQFKQFNLQKNSPPPPWEVFTIHIHGFFITFLFENSLSLCFFFNWAPWRRIWEWSYSSIHSLTLTLDGGEWSASRFGRFTSRERAPSIHWIGGWVGPRAVPNAVAKRKIPSPAGNRTLEPRSSSP